MTKCASCLNEARDLAQCSVCLKCFDFACGGITESGYRKLGDRKVAWKCPNCKNSSNLKQVSTPPSSSASAYHNVDSEMIMSEIKKLAQKIDYLSSLAQDIKSIKDDVQHLKNSVEILILEDLIKQKDQNDRLNNAEIKGVPIKDSENLFEIVSKLGSSINCKVAKSDIKYVVRVPTRNDSKNKNIIVSFNNRYQKENFVSFARASKSLTAKEIGFSSENKIYINDHLTFENKTLLNKTKSAAREYGYSFVWVKNCKIFLRKNKTSPVKNVKSELDLKKL
ncbi:hypothetical protein ACJJTC_002539 [Scirpophaga incertulas]